MESRRLRAAPLMAVGLGCGLLLGACSAALTPAEVANARAAAAAPDEYERSCAKLISRADQLEAETVERMQSDGSHRCVATADGIDAVCTALVRTTDDNLLARIQRLRADTRRDLETYHAKRLADAEQEAAAGKAAKRRAWAAALQGFADGIQGSTAAGTGTAPVAATSAPDGCTGDFQCGAGLKCVKAEVSYRGKCMRLVDGNGLPDLTPRTGPVVVPIAESCTYGKLCSAGFRCDRPTGACVR